MKKYNSCSFFGHRKIKITGELKEKLKIIVEDLIVNHNVSTFLFGSNSNFIDLSHNIVTELKQIYPHIKRISYTCMSETCTLEKNREKQEQLYTEFFKTKVHLKGMEEEKEFRNKYTAGKLSYIERNQEMINDSNYCIFYYDENYNPPLRKQSKSNISYYQPQSGTAIAIHYAKQKRKTIINVFP